MCAEQIGVASSASASLGERTLIESAERYSSLFLYHPHATYSVDGDGYYTDANPVSLAMTGLGLEQMRKTHFSEVLHPDDVHILQEGFERALAGEPQLAEARVVSIDGQVVEIRCTMIPVVVGDRVVGVHGVSEDITEAKQVLRQLVEASAAKSLFLANVSHEVRTPLAAVIGATEFLLDSDLGSEQRRCVEIVHRNGQRLQRLMNDILDFSRLETGRVMLRPEPFAVGAVIEGVADWAVPFAKVRDLSISFTVDESVPDRVMGDGLRVSQVVTNLVQNALKFTERGGVQIRVGARIAAPDPDPDPVDGSHGPDLWVEFAVTDTGVGIAEEDLDALFEPFTRFDVAITRGSGGVGLGLAICRDLADLMGGQIHAASKPGEGSTFTFSVPLAYPGEDDD